MASSELPKITGAGQGYEQNLLMRIKEFLNIEGESINPSFIQPGLLLYMQKANPELNYELENLMKQILNDYQKYGENGLSIHDSGFTDFMQTYFELFSGNSDLSRNIVWMHESAPSGGNYWNIFEKLINKDITSPDTSKIASESPYLHVDRINEILEFLRTINDQYQKTGFYWSEYMMPGTEVAAYGRLLYYNEKKGEWEKVNTKEMFNKFLNTIDSYHKQVIENFIQDILNNVKQTGSPNVNPKEWQGFFSGDTSNIQEFMRWIGNVYSKDMVAAQLEYQGIDPSLLQETHPYISGEASAGIKGQASAGILNQSNVGEKKNEEGGNNVTTNVNYWVITQTGQKYPQTPEGQAQLLADIKFYYGLGDVPSIQDLIDQGTIVIGTEATSQVPGIGGVASAGIRPESGAGAGVIPGLGSGAGGSPTGGLMGLPPISSEENQALEALKEKWGGWLGIIKAVLTGELSLSNLSDVETNAIVKTYNMEAVESGVMAGLGMGMVQPTTAAQAAARAAAHATAYSSAYAQAYNVSEDFVRVMSNSEALRKAFNSIIKHAANYGDDASISATKLFTDDELKYMMDLANSIGDDALRTSWGSLKSRLLQVGWKEPISASIKTAAKAGIKETVGAGTGAGAGAGTGAGAGAGTGAGAGAGTGAGAGAGGGSAGIGAGTQAIKEPGILNKIASGLKGILLGAAKGAIKTALNPMYWFGLYMFQNFLAEEAHQQAGFEDIPLKDAYATALNVEGGMGNAQKVLSAAYDLYSKIPGMEKLLFGMTAYTKAAEYRIEERKRKLAAMGMWNETEDRMSTPQEYEAFRAIHPELALPDWETMKVMGITEGKNPTLHGQELIDAVNRGEIDYWKCTAQQQIEIDQWKEQSGQDIQYYGLGALGDRIDSEIAYAEQIINTYYKNWNDETTQMAHTQAAALVSLRQYIEQQLQTSSGQKYADLYQKIGQIDSILKGMEKSVVDNTGKNPGYSTGLKHIQYDSAKAAEQAKASYTPISVDTGQPIESSTEILNEIIEETGALPELFRSPDFQENIRKAQELASRDYVSELLPEGVTPESLAEQIKRSKVFEEWKAQQPGPTFGPMPEEFKVGQSAAGAGLPITHTNAVQGIPSGFENWYQQNYGQTAATTLNIPETTIGIGAEKGGTTETGGISLDDVQKFFEGLQQQAGSEGEKRATALQQQQINANREKKYWPKRGGFTGAHTPGEQAPMSEYKAFGTVGAGVSEGGAMEGLSTKELSEIYDALTTYGTGGEMLMKDFSTKEAQKAAMGAIGYTYYEPTKEGYGGVWGGGKPVYHQSQS
jgi:hypothetical protein